MKLNFDTGAITVTEFGVGRDNGNGNTYTLIPVDGEVQTALEEMISTTLQALKRIGSPQKYEPSEKHGATEYLYLPLEDQLAQSMRELFEAVNLPIDAKAIRDPSSVYCYFARLKDKSGRHLMALRRAAQFKGILKNRLVRLVTDSLKLINDNVFKLDSDFDLLIDSERVHILRPSAFEFAGNLQNAILAAVPENVSEIQSDIPFVDFDSIQEYASKHPRAARYIASIRGQKETKNINRSALKKLCKSTGVELQEVKGKIVVGNDHVMGFLEVLDRRRYELELVKGSPERFKAASRQKLES